MKILSVLMLCTLIACTKPQTEFAPVTTTDTETPIVNPLQQTDGDSIQVEASVVEYSEGLTNRWKVEVYMSRVVEEAVNVTLEWNSDQGPVYFNATLEPGQRERRYFTEFNMPVISIPENLRITSVSCATPELVFIY